MQAVSIPIGVAVTLAIAHLMARLCPLSFAQLVNVERRSKCMRSNLPLDGKLIDCES